MLSSRVTRCLHRNRATPFSTTKIRTASFVSDDDNTPSNTVASILERVSNGTLPIHHAENEILQMVTTKSEQGKIRTPTTPIADDPRHKNRIHNNTENKIDDDAPFRVGPFANLDHERAKRTSFPEVVFADGKTPEQLVAILDDMAYNVNKLVKEREEGGAFVTDSQKAILATRVSKELYEQVSSTPLQNGTIFYHEIARIISVRASSLCGDKKGESDVNTIPHHTDHTGQPSRTSTGTKIIVACAGTTDIPVAEEAAITLEAAGCITERIYDVGVAGLHRIVNAIPKLRHPDVGCIIVCAGMDGALPSVVTGLVSVPVIAVPTSVGYGASFGGVSAMLTMLNSCAPGVGVVNIDNGFGGAALAYKCIRSNNVDQLENM